ncbi:cyclic peptide export ABC transporter [Bacillus tropicus]|uniref:cyclic peptide export ABC transporter n=1 Tax=Bacillus tropicus TaxID=2026188 RepID=UPI0035E2BED2
MTLVNPVKVKSAENINLEEIQSIVNDHMQKGEIPGLTVVIVDEKGIVYNGNFGYSNIEQETPVTDQTLFELGSNSKAITSLGVMKLVEEEKISLSDPVQKYIPWLEMFYKNKKMKITIGQLLHQTSGIPFNTIKDIPEDSSEDALENTVRNLDGIELDHEPGSKFLYATINYDVLGLVIEKVTGETFEEYMRNRILEPLNLTEIYALTENLKNKEVATGYKMGFGGQREYIDPIFRGNLPAGYFLTSAKGLANWMQLQLTAFNTNSLIQQTHEPNRTVAPDGYGASYAGGWYVYQKGSGELSHGGENPNFSSYIVLRPGENLAVGVMANINTSYTEKLGQEITNYLIGKEENLIVDDTNAKLDKFFLAVLFITVPIFLGLLFYLIKSIYEIIKRTGDIKTGRIKKILLNTLFFLIFLVGMYYLPYVFFDKLDWNFLLVWGPMSLPIAVISILLVGFLFYLQSIINTYYEKPNSNYKLIYSLSLLSLLSGFGNALIIFIINEASSRNTETFLGGLFFYFAVALLIYIVGQKIIRVKLVELTSNIVYTKRLKIINQLLNAKYEKIEEIEEEKIQVCLNNDTERVSNFANIIVTGVTSLITLIFCFVYLGFMNVYGLFLSFFVILLTVALYYFVSQKANKLWEKTRDIQNYFFGYINDIINGFKELSINKIKRKEFQEDMIDSCKSYRDNRIRAELNFANVFVIGELLFVIVIGVVVFVFPFIFERFNNQMIKNYVFVFLYMTGPVHGVLNSVPNALQIRISWKRINKLLEDLKNKQYNDKSDFKSKDFTTLKLNQVQYKYNGADGKHFSVGPINLRFNKGEINFITGGNGSGKSTLVKLLTGLYKPQQGDIHINGNAVQYNSNELGEYYSTVYNDYHLFKKNYGIDLAVDIDYVETLLEELQLSDKVNIINGNFDTTKLSTGQRKRLALFYCYFENKPIVLFDEWAADQDPQYKDYFYKVLLTKFKNEGKCIIAITHDDRYFHVADQLVKMDTGKVVEVMRVNQNDKSKLKESN